MASSVNALSLISLAILEPRSSAEFSRWHLCSRSLIGCGEVDCYQIARPVELGGPFNELFHYADVVSSASTLWKPDWVTMLSTYYFRLLYAQCACTGKGCGEVKLTIYLVAINFTTAFNSSHYSMQMQMHFGHLDV